MCKFDICRGSETVKITFGELLSEEGEMPQFKVVELIKDDSILFNNVICVLGFQFGTGNLFLYFEDNRFLDITGHSDLILWLYSKSKFNVLNKYILYNIKN